MPSSTQIPIPWASPSVDELDWPHIGRRLTDSGFCLLTCGDSEKDRLLRLSRACGTLARHERADEDGVAVVSSQKDTANTTFRGLDANIFPPHSDGAYLDTYTYDGNALRAISPPRLILLQCVHAATSGGESILIDGNTMFAEMQRTDPSLFHSVRLPHFVIARHKNKAINVPILNDSPDGACRYVRFRHDILAPIHAESHLARFFDRYINNPTFWIEFMLSPNQILIVDNFRMLHMRRAFHNAEGSPPRTLRRTWIWNDVWSNDITLPTATRHPAFDDSANYGLIEGTQSTRLTATSGITFPTGFESAFQPAHRDGESLALPHDTWNLPQRYETADTEDLF
jgi:alpha-ketoglutarate-dependent taurine dioxygenase